MGNYRGTIIEESLENVGALRDVQILETKVEPITEKHKTPWLKQWTLHVVEIPEQKAESVTERLSANLEKEHSWYADFKNDQYHYIIYRGKIFKVDLQYPVLYEDARRYGISLGIPEHQVDFV